MYVKLYLEYAIEREKEIKGWTRQKKNNLIKLFNPKWDFLNEKVYRSFVKLR